MELTVQVENFNGILATTSNRVADELGVNHRDLLEKIDGYIKKFGSAESSAGFYILNNYLHPQNKQKYRNYLITKKGIAQLVGGYSSAVAKAFDLNVAYINKFEEMERQLQEQEKIQYSELLSEIDKLRAEINQTPISWVDVECIKDQMETTAIRRMKVIGIDSKYFKTRLKQEMEKDIFLRFGVDYLPNLKAKDYTEVMGYIFNWVEPYQLRVKYSKAIAKI